ncbi:hypothetical protein SR1949_49050 [Sphaerospermopsis reniformis]|uniref:Uncharacterized protein n=1 Tax=Sphaerospermopsis reniformis TaxID=531300 RepID=A0A480A476_9CYAN|nr:hypothetical protein SR1949_49050 [Sphaerospermopsis reniformis]
MRSSEEYRRNILQDLAQGNVESLDNPNAMTTDEYETFDDFAQRTTKDQRRHLFNQSLHPERIPPSQMDPELQKAISQIKPNERDDVARAFFKQLKEKNRALQRTSYHRIHQLHLTCGRGASRCCVLLGTRS